MYYYKDSVYTSLIDLMLSKGEGPSHVNAVLGSRIACLKEGIFIREDTKKTNKPKRLITLSNQSTTEV